MERILRQYEVLADASLRDDYGVARNGWLVVCREYAASPVAGRASRAGSGNSGCRGGGLCRVSDGTEVGPDLLVELVELNGRFSSS